MELGEGDADADDGGGGISGGEGGWDGEAVTDAEVGRRVAAAVIRAARKRLTEKEIAIWEFQSWIQEGTY